MKNIDFSLKNTKWVHFNISNVYTPNTFSIDYVHCEHYLRYEIIYQVCVGLKRALEDRNRISLSQCSVSWLGDKDSVSLSLWAKVGQIYLPSP